jgi:hypothetical protein
MPEEQSLPREHAPPLGRFAVHFPARQPPVAHCVSAVHVAPGGRATQEPPWQTLVRHWPFCVQGLPVGMPPPSQSPLVQTPEAQSLAFAQAPPLVVLPEQAPAMQTPGWHCTLKVHALPGGRPWHMPDWQTLERHWPFCVHGPPAGVPPPSHIPAVHLNDAQSLAWTQPLPVGAPAAQRPETHAPDAHSALAAQAVPPGSGPQMPEEHIPELHWVAALQALPEGRPEQTPLMQRLVTQEPPSGMPLLQGEPTGTPPPLQTPATQRCEAQAEFAKHALPPGKPLTQVPPTQEVEAHCVAWVQAAPPGRPVVQEPLRHAPDAQT